MKKAVVFCLAACAARLCLAGVSITEDFSSDPLASGSPWSFGVGDNSNSQFAWSNSAPAFSGDSNGSLGVHLDSSLPTARLDRALGTTLNGTQDFTVSVEFSLNVTSAIKDGFIQIAFGLVNHSLTGGDRTGTLNETLDYVASGDTFHTVEFNYFPNTSNFAFPGPTLTPAVFGGQVGGSDSFSNFVSLYNGDSDLGANLTGITALPQSQNLLATLQYSAADSTLTLLLSRIEADGSFTLLDTGVPPLDLDVAPPFGPGYDETTPFEVDSMAIMAYYDGAPFVETPTLEADLVVQRFEVQTVPEPSCVLLALVSGSALLARRRKRT